MNENMQGHLLYVSGEITDTVAILRTKGIDPRGFRITASSSCMNLAVRTFRSNYLPDNLTMELTFNANGKNGKIPEVKKYLNGNYSINEENEIQKEERIFGYYSWTDKLFDIKGNMNHFDSQFYVWISAVGHSTDGNFITYYKQGGTEIYGE